MRAARDFIGRLFGFGQTSPQVVPQDDFRTGLQAWVESAELGERGSRVKAMRKMIDARRNRNTTLLLQKLGLSSLPAQIAELTDLTNLNLGNNQLTTIPNSLLNPQEGLRRKINLESNLISAEELISLDKLALARGVTLEISIQEREAMAVAKAALNLLLITAAGNPWGEARDENGSTQTVAELLARGADVNARSSDDATALMLAAENGHTANVSTLLLQEGIDVNAVISKKDYTALMLATQKGYTEIVSALLSCDRINVNAVASNGGTALMSAAYNGHKEIVSTLLLQKGINVNAVNNKGGTALMVAAENGHKEIVDELLARRADVNAKTSDGETALMSAAYNGHKEIVSTLLLQEGIDVNAVTSNGGTALMSAAYNGHTATVSTLLLQEGIDVNAVASNGDTALMSAAYNGHKEIVSALLSRDRTNVNAVRPDGATALMFAAKNGHKEIVSTLLLQEGIDVNAVIPYGDTALMLAAENGHKETISALLSSDRIDVNAARPDGYTALMLAAEKGHTATVSTLLLQEGIDVNAVTSKKGNTALMLAAQKGHTEIVSALLSCYRINVNAARPDGSTALMFGAYNGHTEIVLTLLLQKGIDVNAVTSNGYTALMLAAQNGHTEIVSALLSCYRINVNAARPDGSTALMLAAENGHTATVSTLLLQEGIDVNAVISKKDYTALMLATQKGYTEIVSALLSCDRINVNAVASNGGTALMSAAYNGHKEIVSALLSCDRINVNAVTSNGYTALMLAAQNGHTEIVSALLSSDRINVNAVRPDGATALMFAAKNGHTEIVSTLLLQEGIDVNAVTSNGSTALMLAAQNGHKETVSTLLKTLSKTTDEEVRRHVAREIISIARTPAGQELLATEETKTALLKILSETTDERVKEGLRPLITDITILIPQLQLEAAIKSYKTINSDQSVPRPEAIKTLMNRFLTEEIDQRRESQQEPLEETLEKIANSTKPVLEAFVQEPNHLKWADEIAKAYLGGCVNQPVRGWLEISAWVPIAQAPETTDKIEASKHLRVLEKMDCVTEKLIKESNSQMAGVEVEAGNALFREVHKKLLSNGDISKPWPGVPNLIAYEGTITTWLTEKKIEEAYKEAKETLGQKPEKVASYLARSHHSGTWGLVAFPKELEEIDREYAGRMESLSGNSAEDSEEMISLAKEKEVTVIKAIIDLSETPFKAKSGSQAAAEEDGAPRGIPSSPSSESLSGNEVSKEGKGGSGCVIS